MMIKRIMLGFVFLGGIALVGCQAGSNQEGASIPSEGVVLVDTDEVVDGDVGEESFSSEVRGPVNPTITYYHGRECPHCHQLIAFLPELEKYYPGLIANEYEVWHNPLNAEKARKHVAELGGEFSAVPTIVIEDEVITGFNPERLLQAMETHFGKPVQ